ncbi:hypothetical protein Sps_04778 [Shewanella psychrophila]|uniref:Uncharacterized protein n=1 Tax=Shewanella psychrophila TaxID=225848 RepID=A0A1S6HWI3_9GAMM|nr:N-acetylglucosamine-binding protein GbpA [Shewanella psychrophila]AQS39861.1 hypothetical protein Sps_04778 [Shewanella psychrophila]
MTVNQNLIRLVTVSSLLASTGVMAHAYISTPGAEARGYMCQLGKNSDCGPVQYEPQSLEAPKGFPQLGPVDGKIASAAQGNFSELDEQTPLRWTKNKMEAGPMTMTWHYKAKHKNQGFEYYMTKQSWDPSKPLTRDSFDLTPFCSIAGDGQLTQDDMSHECTVPERSGYQIILGIWSVADTANAFYNVVDVTFDDATPADWSQAGTIYPSRDLKVGDAVMTRVFDEQGERDDLQTRIEITNDSQSQTNVWSYALANKINAEHTDIQAGQVNANGQFIPVYGTNQVYVKKSSNLTSVQIQIDQLVPDLEVNITGVESSYDIIDKAVNINFDAAVFGDTMVVNATLTNHAGTPLAYVHEIIEDNASHSFAMPIANAEVGHHILKIIASPKNGGEYVRENLDIMFKEPSSGEYDYSFPEGLGSYVEGTKVFQPKNNQIYQCKGFPYSGWCNIWNENASQYEPGVGSNSTDAWDQTN